MLIGAALPAPGAAAGRAGLGKLSTIGIFVVSGLTLAPGDALRALRDAPAVVYGVVAVLFITPLLCAPLALALASPVGALGPLVPPDLAAGLAVFCCAPTSLSTCVALTAAAGGDTALALLLVVTTNSLGVLTMPWTACRAFCAGPANAAAAAAGLDPRPLLAALASTVLAPLAAGAFVRWAGSRDKTSSSPTVASFVDAPRNKARLRALSTAFLAAVPWMQISRVAESGQLAALGVDAVARGALAGAVLHLLSLGVHTALPTLLGLGGPGRERGVHGATAARADAVRRPLALCGAQKTLPVAIAALDALGAQLGFAPGVAAVACVCAHFGQTAMDSVLVSWWQARDAARAVSGSAATSSPALLQVVALEAPPPLDVPVWSLATLDPDTGESCHNVVTYACPVGIRPDRLWVISLFRSTQAHSNFSRRRRGVLQLLTARHADGGLIYALGGVSVGRAETEKEAKTAAERKRGALSDVGMADASLPALTAAGVDERTIPGCAAYIELIACDGLINASVDAGDHEVFVCRVGAVAGPPDSIEALGSAECRRRGIVNARGQAVAFE